MKRLLWGKFNNSGQICVAPDYILCSKVGELWGLTLFKLVLISSTFYFLGDWREADSCDEESAARFLRREGRGVEGLLQNWWGGRTFFYSGRGGMFNLVCCLLIKIKCWSLNLNLKCPSSLFPPPGSAERVTCQDWGHCCSWWEERRWNQVWYFSRTYKYLNHEKRFMEPTIVTGVTWEDPLMQVTIISFHICNTTVWMPSLIKLSGRTFLSSLIQQ